MNEDKPFLWRFLRRRQCVVPTWRGWLLLAAACVLSATLAVRNAYNFLAMNAPVSGEILVVEGWGPDYFMAEAVKECQRGHYDGLFTTGGPIETGAMLTKYRTYAEMASATLEHFGADPKSLHTVPSDGVIRDRTYASAVALKKWLSEHNMNVKTITLITVGAHTRRSHLLYEKAFGEGVRVGVICVKDQDFDTQHWWTSSQGFRSVTDEMVAYFYARFLFHAPKQQ